jgi:hypothetical protein
METPEQSSNAENTSQILIKLLMIWTQKVIAFVNPLKATLSKFALQQQQKRGGGRNCSAGSRQRQEENTQGHS